MKNIFAIILLFAGAVSAQSIDRNIDNTRFRLYDNNVLVIGEDISRGRYIFVDADFVDPLRLDALWRPLWRTDQLEQFVFQSHIPGTTYYIEPGSVGRGVFTQEFTQMDAYSGDDRLVRVVKIYETWYFHSGTDNPEYGYTLGVRPDDDTGGRHDTSREDVERRARDLAASSGQEIGVYSFTRITYDALINNNGAWLDVPGLDRITIHLPYRLVQTF